MNHKNSFIESIIFAVEKQGFKIDRAEPVRKIEIIEERLCYFLNAASEEIKLEFNFVSE